MKAEKRSMDNAVTYQTRCGCDAAFSSIRQRLGKHVNIVRSGRNGENKRGD